MALSNLLAPFVPILSYDDDAAEWHASQHTRLTWLGQTPSFADGQIAAIAHVNDLILVTRNTSDYANFQDLEIGNWYR